ELPPLLLGGHALLGEVGAGPPVVAAVVDERIDALRDFLALLAPVAGALGASPAARQREYQREHGGQGRDRPSADHPRGLREEGARGQPGSHPRAEGGSQKSLVTSPPARVARADQVARLMLLLMNFTEPSQNAALTPPEWALRAAAQVLPSARSCTQASL